MKALFVSIVLASVLCSSLYAQDISTGLVARYSFSGNANDSSGNANNGTVSGAVLATDRNGKAASGYLFNGTGDYIAVPHSSSVNVGAGSFSIASWVKPGATTGDWFDIIGKRNTGATGWVLQMGTDQIKLWISSDQNKTIPFNFATDKWYFVAAVRNVADSSINYYVNDSLIATRPFSKSDVSNTGTVGIGRLSGEDIQFFRGTIDEVRLYNRALTAADVRQVYLAGTELVTCWSFDSMRGDTIFSDSARDYRIVNSVTGTISRDTGVVGLAMSCTNQSFKTMIPNSNGKFNYSNISLEAWINCTTSPVTPGTNHFIFS